MPLDKQGKPVLYKAWVNKTKSRSKSQRNNIHIVTNMCYVSCVERALSSKIFRKNI